MHARLLALRSRALAACGNAPTALHLAYRSSSDATTAIAAAATHAGRALSTLAYLPKLHASIPANLTSIQRLVNEYEVRRVHLCVCDLYGLRANRNCTDGYCACITLFAFFSDWCETLSQIRRSSRTKCLPTTTCGACQCLVHYHAAHARKCAYPMLTYCYCYVSLSCVDSPTSTSSGLVSLFVLSSLCCNFAI